ncbi:hypothetical protein HKX48_008955 [Thoreauomyces humboldtii]|nr:hypothetical protein HKX48_008955 [Thoreauomyces humboldtii]
MAEGSIIRHRRFQRHVSSPSSSVLDSSASIKRSWSLVFGQDDLFIEEFKPRVKAETSIAMTVKEKEERSPESAKNMDRLIYYIMERDRIFLRKGAGYEKPWTNDPILAENRFCNNRREDDRGSIFLSKLFMNVSCHDPMFLWNVCTHRKLNTPWTSEELKYVHEETGVEYAIKKLRDWENAWIAAGKKGEEHRWRHRKYQNTAKLSDIEKSMNSNWHLSHNAGLALFGTKASPRIPTFEEAYKKLHTFHGVGEFHANQMALDLYMYGLTTPPISVVPWKGAKKGLLLLGYKPNASGIAVATKEINRRLRIAQEESMEDDDVRMLKVGNPLVFRLSDTEHALCEFQKFVRLLNPPARKRKDTKRSAGRRGSCDSDERSAEDDMAWDDITTSEDEEEKTQVFETSLPATAICCHCTAGDSTASWWEMVVYCRNQSKCRSPAGPQFHPECVMAGYEHFEDVPKAKKERKKICRDFARTFTCETCLVWHLHERKPGREILDASILSDPMIA